MNVIGKDMVTHTCQECAYSVSLGWTEPETGLVFCIHPQMGHIGNWVQRIINAEDKACAHFHEQSELTETR
jgi:hypothetical protein